MTNDKYSNIVIGSGEAGKYIAWHQGQPQDIAPAAVFLASADSAWVTGESLYIAGGLH